MPIHFDIIREGSQFSSRADGGSKFAVGRQVHYQDNRGLANDNSPLGKQFNYDTTKFAAKHPFWADYIAPTAFCEGRSFITLNTYDRACFTFGFTQFAAHVPNGDFVRWMRTMLGRPEANDYFPDLAIENGRIVKLGVHGNTPLETDATTKPLMLYLNPSLAAVDDEEVIAAAKFIHWTMNHDETQALQVDQMVETGHSILAEADKRLGLNGITADLCNVVMDIRHQGRGTYAQMMVALKDGDPYKALLAIGAGNYSERAKTLKKMMDPKLPALRAKKWDSAAREFK